MGLVKEVLELSRWEGGPAVEGDPVDAGEVGGGAEAFAFGEVGEALGGGGEGEDAVFIGCEIEEGEHFAADGFVADPEDEVVAPLEGFDDVGEGEEEGAGGFGVHGVWGLPAGRMGPPRVVRGGA